LNLMTARYRLLMAKDTNPDRWGGLADRPSEVEITVLPDLAVVRIAGGS
jgi:hypothetical protein